MLDTAQNYPGEIATPSQIKLLADEYAKASRAIAELGDRKRQISFAPARWAAIHAIELYLNAFLLLRGHRPVVIRNLQHDFRAKTNIAQECGLNVREKTFEHLASLTDSREYLTTRYAADSASIWPHLNRLLATMEEVAEKVAAVLPEPTAKP
ncbi:hypothetical protein [Mesorhizobium sp. GR13]|uniref:hypothetical protein n=1 Tax=Mesorhizobium sp. GR13 TaxID=2562308 RepID=UPI0010C103A1|nr:hypothetical protein [Mesorhizobium sp. GR13]